MRQLFDLALADGVITEQSNPFKAKLIRPKKPEKVVRKIPTIEQFGAIIENVRAQRDNPDHDESANFLEFLGFAGGGWSGRGNRFEMVRYRPRRITLVRRKTGAPFSFPIYPWLKPLVQRLRHARDAKQTSAASTDANVFHIGNPKHALRNACLRLKLPQFTPRNLRAMCIKRLYDAGVPPKTDRVMARP